MNENNNNESTNNLTECYNCNGANTRLQCGFHMFGCQLCLTHGDGHGKIFKEFRHKEVTAIINGKEYHFTPPVYQCIWCKDKKNKKIKLWDKNFESIATDGGLHQMPEITTVCHVCHEEEYEESYEMAVQEYKQCKEKYLLAMNEFKKYFSDNIIPDMSCD